MNITVKKIAQIGVFAALSYAAFAFLQIKIPLPAGDMVSLHMGNTMVILAALLIGGSEGGIAGAIGMTVGDLLDPAYITYAPKTFICKLLIGVVCGLFAHRLFKIRTFSDNKKVLLPVIISSACGMLFNVIFDPLIGYYYKILILGKHVAEVALKYNIGVTSINAVTSVIIGTLGYMLLKNKIK